jgi:hypothetical protein
MKSRWCFVFCICVGLVGLASGAEAGGQSCADKIGPQAISRMESPRVGSAVSFYYDAAGTLLQADGLEGFVVLDIGADSPVRFPLDAELKMSADKHTRLHGIEDIDLTDFHRGDRVRVKFSTWDGRVVRLKLKRLAK